MKVNLPKSPRIVRELVDVKNQSQCDAIDR